MRTEADSLVLPAISADEREMLMGAQPDEFHVPSHYDGPPAFLPRLRFLSQNSSGPSFRGGGERSRPSVSLQITRCAVELILTELKSENSDCQLRPRCRNSHPQRFTKAMACNS